MNSGTFILIMALASAYAADCTSYSERSVALGWLHGSMFFGFAAGPLLGGFLGMSNGQSRPMLVFNVALVCTRFWNESNSADDKTDHTFSRNHFSHMLGT